ncbi:MAG TPA: phospholipase D-like domain-containing protein [Steroidobacteraceae bacterium]|nr:phospholipase D-like domain-containing protein [Steroidobacteraceae bacterium]
MRRIAFGVPGSALGLTRVANAARRLGATLLACFALASCASVPIVDETLSSTYSPSEIEIMGARGALSKRQSEAVLRRLAAQAPDAGALERHLAMEQAVAESPLFTGNRVQILRDGSQTFPAMFQAIHSAQHYLYLEYYIFEDVACNGEQLGDLLVAKAQAGVKIYVIYDGIGSIDTPSSFFDRLRQAGIQVLQFNPPNPLRGGHLFSVNDRDHRKMLISDGEEVIVGGVNLSSTYESAPAGSGSDDSRKKPTGTAEVWHDIDLEISGPVVVDLERLFREHWDEQHGAPLETSLQAPGERQGNEVVRIIGSAPRRLRTRYYVTVLTAIRSAESSIWITSAYFVPTHQEKRDLIRAARKGVDVRLLLPSRSDSTPALEVQHSHYSSLLRAGVKIFEREGGILHSKTMLIDGVWSITGSSNFDHRSVLFNDEVDAVVLGKDTGEQLAGIFQSDLQHAQQIDPNTWRERSTLTKLREQFWRLWEKLL